VRILSKVKIVKLTIVLALALLTVCLASLAQAASGQGQTFQPVLPPGWKDRSITMVYQAERTSLLSGNNNDGSGNHTLLHFTLIDSSKGNQTLRDVTYSIRISKDKSGTLSVFADTFQSSAGPLLLDITYDRALHSNTVIAGRDQYLDLWTTNNDKGMVKVKTPFLKEDGSYFVHVEVLGAESKGSFFPEDISPKFDFRLSTEDTMKRVAIPEFSVLAIVVLAISFISLIAVTQIIHLKKIA
jgi:hypothetical protein